MLMSLSFIIALRCPRHKLNMSTEPIYKPGDMHNMFSSIVERFQDRYTVNVLSEDPWVSMIIIVHEKMASFLFAVVCVYYF